MILRMTRNCSYRIHATKLPVSSKQLNYIYHTVVTPVNCVMKRYRSHASNSFASMAKRAND